MDNHNSWSNSNTTNSSITATLTERGRDIFMKAQQGDAEAQYQLHRMFAKGLEGFSVSLNDSLR